MQTIGISLGYNTSAAVIGNQGVEFAISEERLTGEKNTKAFPVNALVKCLEFMDYYNELHDEINIGISSYEVINDRTMKYMPEAEKLIRDSHMCFYGYLKEYIELKCRIHHKTKVNISRVEHHEAHALPVRYMSGFLRKPFPFITVTCDGFGDGVSAVIKDQKTNEILAREPISTSMGLVYQFVTGALGFKEHQHEGKITGLAAFGKPKYVEWFQSQLIDYDHIGKQFIPRYKFNPAPIAGVLKEYNSNIFRFDDLSHLKDKTYWVVRHLISHGATREDIAASVQQFTENLVSQWVCDIIEKNFGSTKINIGLAGGLFANVKLNFRIKEETQCDNLYVLPPMGDEGTAIGAGIQAYENINGRMENPDSTTKLYLGRVGGSKTLNPVDEIDFNKYELYQLNDRLDYSKIIAKALAKDHIVCMARGYTEFGPRALGNHSILYNARKKGTNDSLNKKLGRTEFMPFAPITLDKYARDLFLHMDGLKEPLKYMTVAVPVTYEFRKYYKAAFHIDDTARPQILHREDNPPLYRIMEEYYKEIGEKVLINTSFNLHNSPIIFDDKVAYESFVKADLDMLVLDDYIVAKKGVI